MTDNCKRVHFIGVGGVGMSGIARVAADAGMRVSGSDMKSSRYTDDLVAAGIPIFIGHDAQACDRRHRCCGHFYRHPRNQS